MQVEYRLKLGQDEFVLKCEVKNEKEFFEKMSFYSNLPRTAPGGANDLKLVFRTTKKGHKYYSLVSESEKKEFKLGQNLEANGGGLFPKGWEDAYGADDESESTGPVAMPGAPQVQTQAPVQAPIAPPVTAQFAMPTTLTPPPAATAPQVQMPTTVSAPAPAPAQAAPAAPAANPQVAAVANNVLARFGINKQ